MANVTKRTVDYYTNLGLLKAERSVSNYRYYGRRELDRLRVIVELKRNNYSLEEIKMLLEPKWTEDEQKDGLDDLTCRIEHLNKELQEIVTFLEKNEGLKDAGILKKHISHESVTLIQTLLLLLL